MKFDIYTKAIMSCLGMTIILSVIRIMSPSFNREILKIGIIGFTAIALFLILVTKVFPTTRDIIEILKEKR